MADKIVGHRGGTEFFHENTMEAFEKAIKIGADYFELDIQKTKDNKIVCFHDFEVQNKKVYEITHEELKNLSGIDVPLLEETLQLAKGKIKILCEIKNKGYEKQAIDIIKQHFDYKDIIVVSFIDEVLIKTNKLDRSIKTGLIIGKKKFFKILKDLFMFYRMRKCKTQNLMLSYIYTKFGIATIAKYFNIKVFVWTVDEPVQILKHFKNKNIYAVITNKPALAIKLLRSSSYR
jgi:glycerophosphoryl diester phosphodiesterase